MTTRFVGGQFLVWQALRKAFGDGRKAQVAVAFVGKGAFSRMPLAAGSTLVVNASVETVRGGLTDPKELIRYVRAGVRVFTHSALHAKVYVVGKSAYVGSANVSATSESKLTESLLACSEAAIVRKARQFVMGVATERLGPEALRQLSAHYRPPKLFVHGARRSSKKAEKTDRPLVVALTMSEWTDEAWEAEGKGKPIARKQLHNSKHFRIEDFQLVGKRRMDRVRNGRFVYQVVQNGRIMRIHPGGRVVHVEHFMEDGYPSTIVYVELPRDRHARKLSSLPSALMEITRMLRALRSIREVKNQRNAAALARLFD